MSWVIREQKGKIYLAQSLLSTTISGQISVLKRLLKKQAKVQDKKKPESCERSRRIKQYCSIIRCETHL